MPNEFDLAKLIEFNEKAEAQAVYDYTDFLKQANEMALDTETKDKVDEVISEIIADELNHQEKLHKLYVEITGIETKKE